MVGRRDFVRIIAIDGAVRADDQFGRSARTWRLFDVLRTWSMKQAEA